MVDVLIMAAGLGTRMRSNRAKVLHELAGLPLITYVVRTALSLSPESLVVVVGYQAAEVEKVVRDEIERADLRSHTRVDFINQTEQRGTGHAVMAARSRLSQTKGPLLVLAGDGPMLKTETLKRVVELHCSAQNDVTILTVKMENPKGYGRIIRDSHQSFLRCVEERDASQEELAVNEVNVSIYCFEVVPLLGALENLNTKNDQGEYYITDVPAILAQRGHRTGLFLHSDPDEAAGVNTRIDLALLERRMRERKLSELMLNGVTVLDPATTYVHSDVVIEPDTVLHPQVIIEGSTRIGSGCEIQSWTRIRNSEVQDGVTIKNCCVIEDSRILKGASVGPFSRLRAGAEIGETAAIGNFVEVKKSKIGRRTKASHLSYIGDATLGDRVNIGAGTVTCNYDGTKKHQTFIEDEVRIGSDTMLVAPVRIGRGSVTGAGAVVTKDVPPDSLAVGVPAVVKKRLR